MLDSEKSLLRIPERYVDAWGCVAVHGVTLSCEIWEAGEGTSLGILELAVLGGAYRSRGGLASRLRGLASGAPVGSYFVVVTPLFIRGQPPVRSLFIFLS